MPVNDYRYSLLDPVTHARYTPHITASYCDDRRYLTALNARLFDIDEAESGAFINDALADERTRAWLIVGHDPTLPLPAEGEKAPGPCPSDSVPLPEGMTVIGCFVLYATPTYASMAGFGLLPEYRGRGLGMESIDLICSKLPQTVKRLDAHTDSGNAAACALYAKAGFVILEELG